eukprot:CAMPEP_0185209770 /NCGR_PEP_ID=MMETSP1140-20130426/64367_1 /TAXON_ID=298111 /ORGANISM="Pavlova sp., Strain CCMP459" /LENGTH=137 /DNA_ID=CAMNT_0027777537 /DNA_START=28 /DNA_END=441 /DNA_ORIENTATION=-
MGTHEHVEWESVRTALDAIERLRADGVPCVSLETVQGAPQATAFAFPKPCALVLGNERHGLGPDVIGACEGIVQLPCFGVKNSMNVGIAFGICAHEMLRQWAAPHTSHPAAVHITHASLAECAAPAGSVLHPGTTTS